MSEHEDSARRDTPPEPDNQPALESFRDTSDISAAGGVSPDAAGRSGVGDTPDTHVSHEAESPAEGPAGVTSSAVPEYGVEGEPAPATPRAHRPSPKRARRSPWNRGRDWVVVALIAVVVVAVGLVVALKSDNLHTSRALADPPPAVPQAPAAVPGSMAQLWQAPSSATPVPIGTGDTVTTADGGEVAGRDPFTGKIRWHYTRENLQLCTVDTAWGRVNAVYHKSMGCSEVTQLDPETGHITAQRNGDAELGTQLVTDGSFVTTTGKRLLDTWRDDLVKSMEYGKVPFLVNPGKQPRTGCTYGTVAAGADKVGVIERCPGDPHDRLTVYNATAENSDQPVVDFSTVLAGSHARVIAMSGDFTAVLLPDQKLLVIYGPDGTEKTAYPMNLPASDLAAEPASHTEQTSETDSSVFWYTGSETVALSRDTLAPRWTLSGTLGPGITFANQLVVPIKGGLAVLNESNGATLRTVGVDRGGYTGPVRLTALGPILLEQRGPVVAALR